MNSWIAMNGSWFTSHELIHSSSSWTIHGAGAIYVAHQKSSSWTIVMWECLKTSTNSAKVSRNTEMLSSPKFKMDPATIQEDHESWPMPVDHSISTKSVNQHELAIVQQPELSNCPFVAIINCYQPMKIKLVGVPCWSSEVVRSNESSFLIPWD